MKEIIKYPSIPRPAKSRDLLNIEGQTGYVLEKLDGAHASIQVELAEDQLILHAFSRNRKLSESEGLRGFYQYAMDGFKKDMDRVSKTIRFREMVFHGEWLVPHTVPYKEEALHKFYLYDIYDKENSRWLSLAEVYLYAAAMPTVMSIPLMGVFNYKKPDDFKIIHDEFSGKSYMTKEHEKTDLDVGGEGVVLRFDNNSATRIKVVSDKFSETAKYEVKKKTFDDPSAKLVHQFLTDMRIDKAIHKLYDEGMLPEIEFKNFGMIAKPVIEEVYKDILKEEIDPIPDWFDEKIGKKTVNKKVPVRVRIFIEKIEELQLKRSIDNSSKGDI